MNAKNGVPIKEGLFILPSSSGESPRLIGSQCRSCGEAFFPKRRFCRNCLKPDVEEIILSPRGKLLSYTKVHQAPPGYIGKVPYILGKVDLPEGEHILTQIIDCDEDDLEIGMEMELVVNTMGEDGEGNEILMYFFRPVPGKPKQGSK